MWLNIFQLLGYLFAFRNRAFVSGVYNSTLSSLVIPTKLMTLVNSSMFIKWTQFIKFLITIWLTFLLKLNYELVITKIRFFFFMKISSFINKIVFFFFMKMNFFSLKKKIEFLNSVNYNYVTSPLVTAIINKISILCQVNLEKSSLRLVCAPHSGWTLFYLKAQGAVNSFGNKLYRLNPRIKKFNFFMHDPVKRRP